MFHYGLIKGLQLTICTNSRRYFMNLNNSQNLIWKVQQGHNRYGVFVELRRSHLHSSSRKVTIVIVYIDDIIVIGDDFRGDKTI